MSAEAMNPLEAVLRLIAAAAPQPWFPRQHAAKTGFPLERLHYLLELLWLDGLLQKGGGSPETGGGVLLSPAGEEVLRDPEALQRLRDGEPIRPDDRGGIVRTLLRQQTRPVLTRILLWANLIWFGYGLYLAHSRFQAGGAFLSTFGQQNAAAALAQQSVLHQTGSVAPEDLIHGQWWRLLSCCFVHIGLLHLGFNMYGVYVIGRGAEQMWGRWRYLVIYLLSGFGGSCSALAYRPTMLAGASGALCGILGAELVWLLLNGRYLPRPVVRRWWWGMGINLLLLGGFSAMANVSALGHGGGLAVGAVAALLLNLQRFGPAGVRWIMLLPLAALPWLGIELIQRQRAVNETWQKVEKLVYARDYDARCDDADRAFAKAMKPNADLSAEKRLEATLRALKLHEDLDADLGRPGQYRSPEVLKSVEQVRDGIGKRLKVLKKEEEALRPLAEKEENRKAVGEKDQRKREQEEKKELDAFDNTYRQRITDTTEAAEKVVTEQIKPLLARPPEARKPDEVEKALKALDKQRAALGELAAALKAAGNYRSEKADQALQVGRGYVVGLDRWLEIDQRCLRAGKGWLADAADGLKVQGNIVEGWRSKWLELNGK